MAGDEVQPEAQGDLTARLQGITKGSEFENSDAESGRAK